MMDHPTPDGTTNYRGNPDAETTLRAAYNNPYEPISPYYGDKLPIPPPPPTRRTHKWLILALASVSCMVVILGGVLLYVVHYLAQLVPSRAATTPLATSTAALPPLTPTIAQMSQAPDAVAIYNDVALRLDPATHHIGAVGYDNAWQGWPYTPERRAFMWHDNSSLFEIAAYANSYEATADANYNAAIQGNTYRTNVVGACMFLYDSGASTVTAADYLSILADEPGCKL